MKKQRNWNLVIMAMIRFYLTIYFLLAANFKSLAQQEDKEIIDFLKSRNQFSDSLNISNDLSLFRGTYFLICEKKFVVSGNEIILYSFGSNASHTKTYSYVSFNGVKNKKGNKVFLELNKLHLDIEKIENFTSELSNTDKLRIYKILIPALIKIYEKNM